ncbi:MAG: flagellar hook-associated protein FlgK [Phycisphaerae bacterium]|jgi:flagellar hook-associated protein FlgK
MPNFSIGLSGIQVSQRALELIGANIANAGTEGYHRQDLTIVPMVGSSADNDVTGAEVSTVRRAIDQLTENQLLRQQTLSGQTNEELSTLQLIESSFGDVSANRLAGSLEDFFGALRQLAAQPNSPALQEQVIAAGQSLGAQFRDASAFLRNAQEDVRLQAEDMVRQVNTLTGEIADINAQIGPAEAGGAIAGALRDRRGQCMTELAALVDIQSSGTTEAGADQRLYAWDIPIVAGMNDKAIQVGLDENMDLGLSAGDYDNYIGSYRGGKLGAMLSLANDLLPGLADKLDALAGQVITEVNRLHVQGVGTGGSFSELVGQAVGSGAVSDLACDVTAGDFYVRVTDASGLCVRTRISVDPATDTVADVVARLNAVSNLSANIADSCVRVSADVGYTFDFVPALPASVDGGTIGASAVQITGLYSGSDNQEYTFTVAGAGTIGVTEGLSLEVHNEAGELVQTFNIGRGYASGDKLTLSNGIEIALGAGTVADGDEGTCLALANSDTSGFLAAAGLNVFFTGSSAQTIGVREDLAEDPSLLAGSVGQGQDQQNIQRLAEVGQAKLNALGGVTCSDYFTNMVTNLGQEVATRQVRQTALDSVTQQLENQRSTISGVDVNEQTIQLTIYQRMFQSMARFLNIQDQTMQYLTDIIS